MSYADQPAMSPRKAVSIGLVVLLHVLIGYAFITGLAFNVIKKAAQDLKTVDIKDQPPPPDKPPPPPPPQTKTEPPPPVAPPPIVQAPVVSAPQIVTVAKAPPAPPPPVVSVAPPALPPVIHTISQAAQAKGNPASWVTTDDYPPSALRDGKQGRVVASWTVNEQGRVDSCTITQSSGVPELDDTTCKLIVRRARYTPAKDQSGNPIKQTDSRPFRWQIPAE